MIYDLIIIGAGPAGVSAAIYASRQKLNILVITKELGGQVAKKSVNIENYLGFDSISGPDLIKIFTDQLEKNKVEVVTGEVATVAKEGDVFKIKTTEGDYEALSVIVASGADPRPLEVEGEKEFTGKGVSYCPLCDGPIFRDKVVAIAGGGNSGFESAVFLANYVKKMYILEYGDKVKADQENQDMVAKGNKAEIITNAKILKIEGSTFVKSLTYEDLVSGEEKKLDVEGVFVGIGNSPATAFVKGLVDFSDRDEIITEPESGSTKTPGLYAAGDCNKGKYKQIIAAAGEGAKSALAAYEFLQKTKK